jgi:hypothetical protein
MTNKELRERPLSFAILERGIRGPDDFICLMSALMADVLAGRLTPKESRAINKQAGELLKTVETCCRLGALVRRAGAA